MFNRSVVILINILPMMHLLSRYISHIIETIILPKKLSINMFWIDVTVMIILELIMSRVKRRMVFVCSRDIHVVDIRCSDIMWLMSVVRILCRGMSLTALAWMSINWWTCAQRLSKSWRWSTVIRTVSMMIGVRRRTISGHLIWRTVVSTLWLITIGGLKRSGRRCIAWSIILIRITSTKIMGPAAGAGSSIIRRMVIMVIIAFIVVTIVWRMIRPLCPLPLPLFAILVLVTIFRFSIHILVVTLKIKSWWRLMYVSSVNV